MYCILKLTLMTLLTGSLSYAKPKSTAPIEILRVNSTPKNKVLRLQMQKIKPPMKLSDRLNIEVQGFSLGQIYPSNLSKVGLAPNVQGARIMVYMLAKNTVKRFYIHRNNGLSINEEKSYRSRLYSKKIPSNMRFFSKNDAVAFLAVPISGYGETVKGPDAVSLMCTSFKDQVDSTSLQKDLTKPLLCYNRPSGTYLSGEGVLLDFYLLNCALSRYYGYTVSVVIKNNITGGAVHSAVLNHWSPYIIKNLPKGRYLLELSLIYKGKVVKNPLALPSKGYFVVK